MNKRQLSIYVHGGSYATTANLDDIVDELFDGLQAGEDRSALLSRLGQANIANLNSTDATSIVDDVIAEEARLGGGGTQQQGQSLSSIKWGLGALGVLLIAGLVIGWMTLKESESSAGANQIASLSTRFDALDGKVDTLTAGQKRINDNVVNMGKGVGTALTTLSTNLTTLSTNLATLDGKVTTNGSSLTTLTSNLATLDGKVTTNGTALTTLTTNLTKLDGIVTAALTRTVRCRKSDPKCTCVTTAGKERCTKVVTINVNSLRGSGGGGTRTRRTARATATATATTGLAIIMPGGRIKVVRNGVPSICHGTYDSSKRQCIGQWHAIDVPTVAPLPAATNTGSNGIRITVRSK